MLRTVLAAIVLATAAVPAFADVDQEAWAALSGRRWVGEEVDGKPVAEPGSVTLIFGLSNGVNLAYGTGGCNSFQGPVESLSSSRIKLGLVASTSKACDKPGVMEQEGNFLLTLQNAQRFSIENGKLTIRTDARKKLTFTEQAAGATGATGEPATPPAATQP